ncbi:glutathione S-transferase T1-like protein, partial [Tanacetum coccineum]
GLKFTSSNGLIYCMLGFKLLNVQLDLNLTLSSLHCMMGQFLLGNSQPSIADISIACQVMQLEVLSERDHSRILAPNERVIKWIEDVRSVTAPFFDEVHEALYDTKKKVREQMATQSRNNELNSKTEFMQ